MILGKLKFCTWNIHGYKSRAIGNKLHNEEFLEILSDIDFIGITETHMHDDILENLSIPGFHLIDFKNRKKKIEIKHSFRRDCSF